MAWSALGSSAQFPRYSLSEHTGGTRDVTGGRCSVLGSTLSTQRFSKSFVLRGVTDAPFSIENVLMENRVVFKEKGKFSLNEMNLQTEVKMKDSLKVC